MNHNDRNYAVKIFKALGNGNRIKILEALGNGKSVTVGSLSEKLDVGQATVSTHLARMRRDGLVKAKQDGLNMHYSIKDPNVLKLLSAIKS